MAGPEHGHVGLAAQACGLLAESPGVQAQSPQREGAPRLRQPPALLPNPQEFGFVVGSSAGRCDLSISKQPRLNLRELRTQVLKADTSLPRELPGARPHGFGWRGYPTCWHCRSSSLDLKEGKVSRTQALTDRGEAKAQVSHEIAVRGTCHGLGGDHSAPRTQDLTKGKGEAGSRVSAVCPDVDEGQRCALHRTEEAAWGPRPTCTKAAALGWEAKLQLAETYSCGPGRGYPTGAENE